MEKEDKIKEKREEKADSDPFTNRSFQLENIGTVGELSVIDFIDIVRPAAEESCERHGVSFVCGVMKLCSSHRKHQNTKQF